MAIACILFGAGAGAACGESRQGEVCLRDACISVDIADTPELREKGLMWRESLPEGRGMWFVFSQPLVPAFWMGNMRFPIDIIWIDARRKVLGVSADLPVCITGDCLHYVPPSEVLYVLEVPAGYARRHGVRAGDEVTLPEAVSPRRSGRD